MVVHGAEDTGSSNRLSTPERGRVLYVVAGIVVGVVLVVVVLALAATTPTERLDIPWGVPAPGDPAFLDLVALTADVRFTAGNDIELVLDGRATFDRLFADLRAARRTITLQVYYCAPGRIADELAAILVERARAGVRVLFLDDAFGSELSDDYFQPLRAAGVDARTFRPLRWWTLYRAHERSHARIVVIDGVIGYTGGFGIDDRWSARGTSDEPGWRDTNVRFTGPAVASLQAAFAAGWAETAGQLLMGDTFYPGIQKGESIYAMRPDRLLSPVIAGLIHSRPDVGASTAERLLSLTIAAARKRLYIANAYFVPSDEFRELLIAAARRGVDVRVLTPSDNTDIPLVRYAGRGMYDELLGGGIRIYEYQPAMMHAKTLVADGVWSIVGTLNFDNRSLSLNEETSLLIQDPDIGARMDDVFLQDLRRAIEITPESFALRPRWERVKEGIAVRGARLL
jgi:cardiolipin synthase A/B